MRALFAFGLYTFDGSLFDPMITLFALFFMRVLLRKQWIAAAAAVAILTIMSFSSGPPAAPAIDIPATVLLETLEVLVLLHFGVPAVIVADVISNYVVNVPNTLDFSSWYASTGLLACFSASAKS